MKKTNALIFLILSLFLINCKNNDNKHFLINGEIQGDFNDYIYLKYNDKIDSSLIKDKKFNFKGEILNPTRVSLYPGNPSSNTPMIIAGFMLENSDISIYLKYSEREFRGMNVMFLRLDSVIGSISEDLKNNFDLLMNETFHKEENDSLKAIFLYNNLYNFINENPKLVLSGNYLAGINNRYDYLDGTQMENLFKLLDTNYQEKKDLYYIRNIINRRKVLKIGTIPPKVILPNQYGELIDSGTLKGKFVLLEFWASWCGPCRKANPELLKVYTSFKNQGFEIFGISQDKDRAKWIDAIKVDRIDWLQVIDTLNKSGEKYYLTTIPYNVLLNRDRAIIARNIKPSKLNEILKEKLSK